MGGWDPPWPGVMMCFTGAAGRRLHPELDFTALMFNEAREVLNEPCWAHLRTTQHDVAAFAHAHASLTTSFR